MSSSPHSADATSGHAYPRSLPVSEWPDADRRAWEEAYRPGLRLKPGGVASHLTEVSRNDFARRYGDCLERGVDLVECGLSHCGILAPLGKEYQRDALVAKAAGPVQQHALAGSFCQRLAKGGDGLC